MEVELTLEEAVTCGRRSGGLGEVGTWAMTEKRADEREGGTTWRKKGAKGGGKKSESESARIT